MPVLFWITHIWLNANSSTYYDSQYRDCTRSRYIFFQWRWVCVCTISKMLYFWETGKKFNLNYHSRDDGSFSMSQRNNVILNSFLCWIHPPHLRITIQIHKYLIDNKIRKFLLHFLSNFSYINEEKSGIEIYGWVVHKL